MSCSFNCLQCVKKFSVLWFVLSIVGLSTALTLILTYHEAIFQSIDKTLNSEDPGDNDKLILDNTDTQTIWHSHLARAKTTVFPVTENEVTSNESVPKNILAIWSTGGKFKPPDTSALVLNDNMGVLTDIELFPVFGEINADVSCSVHYQGRMYLLGGGLKAQHLSVSEVVNCKVKAIGRLAVKYDFASCAATQSEIIMCFNSNSRKLCHKVT